MSRDMVSRIGALLREIPPRDCDEETRAAWFEQKADTFDAIAEQEPSLAGEAAEVAHNARAQARRIRAGGR